MLYMWPTKTSNKKLQYKQNIFFRYDRHDAMHVKELKNIMANYGKVKSINITQYQNGGTENRATICNRNGGSNSNKRNQ